VPNSLLTEESAMMGIKISLMGCKTCRPMYLEYLSSFGCTAIATSPKIVSGLVVATIISSSVKQQKINKSARKLKLKKQIFKKH